jgi:putative ABC transport system permease protein
VDAWLAAGFKAAPFPSEPSRRSRPLPGAIARLKPGISLAQAGAALEGLSASIRRDHPADYPDQARWSLRVAPLGDEVVGRVDRILLALSGAVALVLLIACANVANLLLARSSSRQTEMAIRLAVGAERGRLVRQLLTESLVLASVGGAAGVAAAYWAQPLLMAMLPSGLPRLHEIGISASVLAFGVGITILASGLSGIVPALQASKAPLVTAIAEGGRAGAGGARQRGLRTALVVAEIALSLVLVTGAGLLLKTVTGLLRVDPGFTTEHVMVAKAWIAVPNNPDADRYRTAAARTALARSIVSRLREIPEVASAALTTALPLSHAAATVPVQVEGQPNEAEAATAGLISVTPDYFSILQIPLIRGRWFVENDEVGGQLVAIVDEAAARRLFAGEDPLGRRIQVGRPGAQTPTAVVVGIVRDAKYRTLDAEPAPHIYVPLYQRSGRSIAVVVRTRVTPDGLHDEIERAVQQADADLPVFGVEPLGRTVSASVAQQRFSAQAVTAFAVLAIVLAAIGVYGVMACAVTTRTREIGLRMAIGATPGMVLTSVLGDSLRAALTGVALGLVLSAMVVPFIRAMLFGVAPIDPLVFVSSSLLLVAAALAAAYIPARRAARVDPLLSLRHM